jgi:hypothetical protein
MQKADWSSRKDAKERRWIFFYFGLYYYPGFILALENAVK